MENHARTGKMEPYDYDDTDDNNLALRKLATWLAAGPDAGCRLPGRMRLRSACARYNASALHAPALHVPALHAPALNAIKRP